MTIASIPSDLAFHGGNFIASFSRNVSSLSGRYDRHFIFPTYLLAISFLGIIFPHVWTGEETLDQVFWSAVAFTSYVVAISCILYMIIVYVAKKRGWIE